MRKNELFVNGELTLSRKDTYGKRKRIKSVPVYNSRIEKHKYHKGIHQFDIRNVVDVNGLLNDIRANWNTYVSQVNQWIQKNPVKKVIVTGIFTIALGFISSTANAAVIQEYTYQVKNGDKIEDIAKAHGVTAQGIIDANGLFSIDGKKILLPKVQDRTVTASILNVRSQPNTESSIIGKLKQGDVVKVSFVENGWAGILINGQVCFVSANYLTQEQAGSLPTIQKTGATVASKGTTMYVTASSLRVREKASTNSAILGSLPSNSAVSVLSRWNGWAQIHYNGKTAFVNETFLSLNVLAKNQTSKIDNTKTSSSVYVIKSGETFIKISKALGISVTAIQALNPTVDPSKLKIGQEIKIPTSTVMTANQIIVEAQIGIINPKGVFCFNTSDGKTYTAKASGNLLNDLKQLQGKKVLLSLEGKRGQELTLKSIH